MERAAAARAVEAAVPCWADKVLGKAVGLVAAGSAAVLGAEGMVGGVEAADSAAAAMVEGDKAAASAAAMVEAGRTAAMAVAEAAKAVERVAVAREAATVEATGAEGTGEGTGAEVKEVAAMAVAGTVGVVRGAAARAGAMEAEARVVEAAVAAKAVAWAARVETEVALEVAEREVVEEAGPTSWVEVDGGAVVVVDRWAEMVEREAAARGAAPVALEEGEETRRHSRPGCTRAARAVCRGAFAPDPHRSCKRTHAPRRATCSSQHHLGCRGSTPARTWADRQPSVDLLPTIPAALSHRPDTEEQTAACECLTRQ